MAVPPFKIKSCSVALKFPAVTELPGAAGVVSIVATILVPENGPNVVFIVQFVVVINPPVKSNELITPVTRLMSMLAMIVPDISEVALPPANPRANRLAVGDGVLRVIVTEMMSARTREEVNITIAQDPNNLLKFIAQIPHNRDNRDAPALITKSS